VVDNKLRSFGITPETGILLAAAGVAVFLVINHFGTANESQRPKKLNRYAKAVHHKIPTHPYSSPLPGSAGHVISHSDSIKHRMGLVVPLHHTKINDHKQDPFVAHVGNSSYSNTNDDARGDGFTGAYFSYSELDPPPTLSLRPIQHRIMSPYVNGALNDIEGLDPTENPNVTKLKNVILKQLVANAANAVVILSNIDTIKAAIKQRMQQIAMLQSQLDSGAKQPSEVYLMCGLIVMDIAQQLQIEMKPDFIAMNVPELADPMTGGIPAPTPPLQQPQVV
jgi:hypothetical protein